MSIDENQPTVATDNVESRPPVIDTSTLVPYNDISNIAIEDIRICIAEDNLVNQKIMLKYLKLLGFTNIDIYENGQLVVDGIRQKANDGSPYHLVFMDVSMPVLDGFSATRLIRDDTDPTVRGVLAIALAAGYIPDAKEYFLKKGMNDFCAKPFRISYGSEILGKYIAALRPDTPDS